MASPADPYSAGSAAEVLRTWTAITGRDAFDAVMNETFTLDDADYLARPYPYSSSNPMEVGNYFGAVAAAVARTGGPPPRRIVEYGSGWGHLALALAQTGYDVTAVDLNPASVELLRLRAKVLGVNLDVAQCGFLEYESDEPVDVVIFFESFHHCARPFELLDRCTADLSRRADGCSSSPKPSTTTSMHRGEYASMDRPPTWQPSRDGSSSDSDGTSSRRSWCRGASR